MGDKVSQQFISNNRNTVLYVSADRKMQRFWMAWFIVDLLLKIVLFSLNMLVVGKTWLSPDALILGIRLSRIV
jgi:hypothetical protein